MGATSSKTSDGSKNSSPSLEDIKTGGSGAEGVHAPLHMGPIHCLCSVGEDCIASAGADKDVVLLCWRERCVQARLEGPVKDVTKVCYNNTGSFIYAASRDRSVYAWRWPRQEVESNSAQSDCSSVPTATLQGHTLGVSALDTSDAHPQLLCSGSRDNSVCLWDVDVGKPVSSMYAPRNLVTDLKWIPKEMAVVQSSEDKTLRVWDLTTCSTVQHFRARTHLQMCCAVSHDQQYLLAGSSGSGRSGGQLTLWDRRNERRPLREVSGHEDGVYGCSFLSYRSRTLLCSVGGDASVRVWEQDSFTELCQDHLAEPGPLTSLVSPHEQLLVCSSFSGGISFWTLTYGTVDESISVTLTSRCM